MLPDFVQGKLRPIIHKHPGLPVLLFLLSLLLLLIFLFLLIFTAVNMMCGRSAIRSLNMRYPTHWSVLLLLLLICVGKI